MDIAIILEFAKIVGRLKRIKRTGWVREGVKNPESVAGHTYRMAVLALVLCPELGLSTNKILKMVLIHDLPEALVGDWVVERGNSKMNTAQKELEGDKAANTIFSNLPCAQEFLDLWEELKERKSPEAKFLRELDKLEMAMTASDYIEEGNDRGKLQEFFENAKANISTPRLLEIFNLLKR